MSRDDGGAPASAPTGAAVRTRGHKKKERTRRRLLDAAVRVIAERGEAFTVGHVVDRAGVSNGTFYNYFLDREELIDAVVPEVLVAFAAEGAALVTDADPAVRFATITALAFVRSEAAPESVRVVLRLDAVQRAMLDGEMVGHLRDDLSAGLASGRFAAASLDAAVDVVVATTLLAARRLVDGSAGPGYAAEVIEQLLCSLGLPRVEAEAVAGEAVAVAASLPGRPLPANDCDRK